MEKVKIGKQIFDTVPGGVSVQGSVLRVIVHPGEMGLEALEQLLTPENCQRVELLDVQEALIQPFLGYTTLSTLKKIKNYQLPVINPDETAENADVAVITLRQQDRVDKLESDVTALQVALVEIYESET